MTKREFILNHFSSYNDFLYSLVTPRYAAKGVVKIGPNDSCLNGLIDFPYSNDLLCDNINTIVFLSHLTLDALNGQKEFTSGNIVIVNNLYGYNNYADIRLFYLNRPILSLITATTFRGTFNYEAFPTFPDDNTISHVIEQLGNITHILA